MIRTFYFYSPERQIPTNTSFTYFCFFININFMLVFLRCAIHLVFATDIDLLIRTITDWNKFFWHKVNFLNFYDRSLFDIFILIKTCKLNEIECTKFLSKIILLNTISFQAQDMFRSICKRWCIYFESYECS